ncbi:MAG: acyl-homoserine-lactone acylase [Solirubrobacteraceae bacterium]|jgi:acyl-homoserine-lactone acylase|nr:acyl-homoserine-lactone acylase [Solirubrobacteraceae bacterium]
MLGVALALALAVPAHADYDVTISRTAHGVPHIYARDVASLSYGWGYAFAQDNICTIADQYVTVNAQRSRYFGPNNRWVFGGNGASQSNLNSDFFYQRVNDSKAIEKLVAEAPPRGPLPEIKQGVSGYVDGYNAYLRDTGVDKIPDPRCRGKAWVRPITEMDAYRRFYQLASLASQGVAIEGIGSAQPLTGGSQTASAASLAPAFEKLGDIGSNAYGFGRDQTDDGHGIVLGNPHFPWDGSERLYQSHLTVPGKIDVAGASLYGVPLILIGSTKGMAWSHTVSTARRFTLYEEKLVPGAPTTYLNDGAPTAMKADKVTVKAQDGNGGLVDQSRTLYSTRHGPVLTSLLGLPVFPWSPATAYTMADANATNFRYLNHFYEVDQAQSVRELDRIERRYQGIPWVNTIAADASGEAYYADIGSVPGLTNAKAQECNTPEGAGTFAALAVAILDGSRSACDWETGPGAVAPGILGPSQMPSLFRRDFVHNGNDSYWLTNPHARLEGFPRIIGDERTARSLRTRLGLVMADGHKFSVRGVQDTVFNDRHYGGELLAGELAAYCRANPTLSGSNGPVDVSAACPVLEKWDRHDSLDSPGAVLFRRWATRALASVGGVVANPSVFREPFNADDPVNTPRGLNTSNPQVGQALADAVTDLRTSGIPLDGKLRDWQYEMRGTERIPIHGGPGGLGVFNAIANPWVPGKGYPDVVHGSSFVMVAKPNGRCTDMHTLVTYSQSENPDSPYFADQTRMFSRKEWNDFPFCASELAAAPGVKVQEVGCLSGNGLRSARVSAMGRRGVRLSFLPALAAPATAEVVRVAGPGGLLRRAVVVRRAKAARRLDVRGLADGWYVARISARAVTRKLDRREVGFRVVGGRVVLQPSHDLRERCGLLRSATLGAPVFGARLRARVRVDARARVAVAVLRGSRVIAGSVRTLPAGATRTLTVRAAGLAHGARYRVRIRVSAGGKTASAILFATRL